MPTGYPDVCSGIVPSVTTFNNGTAVVSFNGRNCKTYTGHSTPKNLSDELKVLYDKKNNKFDDPTFYTA